MQGHNDVREKPLIILDIRHKTSMGDKITCLRTYINWNKIASATWSCCRYKCAQVINKQEWLSRSEYVWNED